MPDVDYGAEAVASRYVVGRALPPAVLERWREAVTPLLPPRPHWKVLDLGAGTGIFARSWPQWCDAQVLAVEPAGAMRSEMVRAGTPDGVHLVAGRGEQLPARDSSFDVAWLSTVLHHLVELPSCIGELRRVLTGDGVVLIRGLFSDLGHPAGLELMPGWAEARRAFPVSDVMRSAFTAGGFELVAVREVEDAGPATVGQLVDRIHRLRHADSLLQRFSDEQIDDALAAMAERDPREPLAPSALGLVAFARASPLHALTHR